MKPERNLRSAKHDNAEIQPIKCDMGREDPIMRLLRDRIRDAILAGYQHFDANGAPLDEDSIIQSLCGLKAIVVLPPTQKPASSEE